MGTPEARDPIRPDQIGDLSIGRESGALYWKEKKIKAELSLTPLQKLIAVITVLTAILSQGSGAVKTVLELHDRFSETAPPPEVNHDPLVAYTVFFGNGTANISKTQLEALNEFVLPLRACRGLELRARGYASSAPYTENNDTRNVNLSAQRVDTVAKATELTGIRVMKEEPWYSVNSMTAAQDFQDSAEDKARITDREAFNRRVELRVMSYGTCGKTHP